MLGCRPPAGLPDGWAHLARRKLGVQGSEQLRGALSRRLLGGSSSFGFLLGWLQGLSVGMQRVQHSVLAHAAS